MKKEAIDLSAFHQRGTILLSGRPKGVALREQLNLDRKDQEKDLFVEVIVPREVVSLNSSFFSGLFGPSIKILGETGFRQKYSFNCSPAIDQDIEGGISEALNESNPLSKPCK